MSTKNFNNRPDAETVAEAHRAKNEAKKDAGVVEGQPGIIETTHIDPLDETFNNKDDNRANVKSEGAVSSAATTAATTAASLAQTAANAAAGAAKYAYTAATGEEPGKERSST